MSEALTLSSSSSSSEEVDSEVEAVPKAGAVDTDLDDNSDNDVQKVPKLRPRPTKRTKRGVYDIDDSLLTSFNMF